MSVRLEAESALVRELFPAAYTGAYAAVTDLGSATVLLFGLAVTYWVTPRREVAAVVGYGFVGYAVVVVLKTAFALARPPESVHLVAADGYGFPSGHAVAAVVVYGGLAVEFDWLDDPRKAGAVAVVVAAVALSRVVLGVHYLGDVVAGVVVGALVVAGTRRLARGDPRLTFAVGTPAALVAVAVTGAGATALGILGACVGGLVAGRLPDASPAPRSTLETGAVVVVGLLFVGALRAAEPTLEAMALGALVDDMAIVVGVFAAPLGVARLGAVAPVEWGPDAS